MSFVNFVTHSERPLAAPLSGFPGLSLTESTLADNLHDSALQARTLIALNTAVDFDIVFPMMDLTVEAEALGGKIDWETDEMPTIRGASVETMEQAQALTLPKIGDGNRLDVFVDTCKTLKEAFPNKLVWAYCLGPFSIAGRLMGMTEISLAVKLEPEVVHEVLRKCNNLLRNYVNALLDTGVDGLMILEPASSLLRESDANEFSNTYVKELADIIVGRGKTPALHNCGSIGHLIESLCATGIEALSIGSVMDPAEVYPKLTQNVVLLGNLDPTEVFLRGSETSVREAACKLSDRMADCERFVISSGCDIPPGTSVKNMKSFADAIYMRKCALQS